LLDPEEEKRIKAAASGNMQPVAEMVKRRARTAHERKQEGQFIAQERLNIQSYAKRMLAIQIRWRSEAKNRSLNGVPTDYLQKTRDFIKQNLKDMETWVDATLQDYHSCMRMQPKSKQLLSQGLIKVFDLSVRQSKAVHNAALKSRGLVE